MVLLYPFVGELCTEWRNFFRCRSWLMSLLARVQELTHTWKARPMHPVPQVRRMRPMNWGRVSITMVLVYQVRLRLCTQAASFYLVTRMPLKGSRNVRPWLPYPNLPEPLLGQPGGLVRTSRLGPRPPRPYRSSHRLGPTRIHGTSWHRSRTPSR